MADPRAGNGIRVAVAGAGGRMGRALVEAVVAHPGLVLAAALDVPGSPALGHDAGEACGRATGVLVAADVDAALARADVLIDFTRPEGTLAHLAACARHRVAAVVGTTGLDAAQKDALAGFGRTVPIVFAANMSVGINVLLSLVESAARALGPAFDIEIVEMHHKHKIDSPSGTARTLLEILNEETGTSYQNDIAHGRLGNIGPRKPKEIGMHTLRGGDVVGDHTVIFAADGERVELTHKASSRLTFAAGAVRAAVWLQDKPAGLYDMQDVLGLG